MNKIPGICLAGVAAALLCGAAAVKEHVNGFMGHYGYLASYPVALEPAADFQGPVEKVDFLPKGVCDNGEQVSCAKGGWVSFLVMPKWYIAKANGFRSFETYMAAVLADSKNNGEAPTMTKTHAGKFAACKIVLKSPKGPFNEMLYISGKKVYYRFAYVRGTKYINALVKGLEEVQPSDTPPAGWDK